MDLWQYGKALDSFFDTMQFENPTEIAGLVRDLTREYELTKRNKTEFADVAVRTFKAQQIVKYLGNRFGVDDDGMIQDPHGLYGLIFKNKKVPQLLEARSYGFSVGIRKLRWRHSNYLGFVTDSSPFDLLKNPLEKTIKKLDKNKKTSLWRLTFLTKDELYDPARIQQWLTSVKERAEQNDYRPSTEVVPEETIYHEIRHIIDNILGIEGGLQTDFHFVETQADFSCYRGRGLDRDYQTQLATIDWCIKRDEKSTRNWNRHISEETPGSITHQRLVENKEIVEKSKRELEHKKEMAPIDVRTNAQHIKQFHPRTWKALSYLVSLSPDEYMRHHLEGMLDRLPDRDKLITLKV